MGIVTGGQNLKVELRNCQGTWIGCGKEITRGIQGTQEPLEEGPIWGDNQGFCFGRVKYVMPG